jgi:hypothetical protein
MLVENVSVGVMRIIYSLNLETMALVKVTSVAVLA